MSYYSLYGAKFFVSTGLANATDIASITNAAPPVVNAAAHGLNNNEEAVLFTGWEDFGGSVVRASAVGAGVFTIADYDATNQDLYPQASSVGKVQKVAGWLGVGQVLGINASGGDASYDDLKPFDKRNGTKVFQGFAGSAIEFTLGWDRALNEQKAFQAASRVAGKRALKFVLPGGVYAYAYGTVSASAMPQFEPTLKQKVVFTLDGMFTSFGG